MGSSVWFGQAWQVGVRSSGVRLGMVRLVKAGLLWEWA